MAFEQIAIAGIYWPLFLADLLIALAAYLLLRFLLTRVHLHQYVWHPALFEVALLGCIVSVVVLVLNP